MQARASNCSQGKTCLLLHQCLPADKQPQPELLYVPSGPVAATSSIILLHTVPTPAMHKPPMYLVVTVL